MQTLKKILIIVGIIAGVVVGLSYLNSAAYHYWLSYGPPVDNPDYHSGVSFKHLLIALFFISVSVVVFVITWKKRKKNKAKDCNTC